MSSPAVSAPWESAPFNVAAHLLCPPPAERAALLTVGGMVTYGALRERAGRIAAALARLGIEPEQRVALYLDESADLAAAFWGVLWGGAVAVPASPRLSGAELASVLADSRARAVVVDRALWPRLAPHRDALRHLEQVVLRGEPGDGLPTLAALEADAPTPAAAVPLSPDDDACWLYTSGTTGAPKAAVHLHRNLAATAAIFPHAVLGLGPADTLLSAARMHFAYGLGNSLLFPPEVGCAAALHEGEPAGPALLETLARHRPTVLFAGPAHLRAILAAWRARPGDATGGNGGASRVPARPAGFERLRFAVSAGEALPEGLYRAWRESFGVEVLDAIGSTENLTFYTVNRPGTSRAGSAGEAVPGFDLRLVDETGRAVPPGEPGLLWVRGPTAAARYWNRSAASRAAMRGPWLVTGDRFRREPDGHYTFLGREDARFKVSGAWVAPMEVERALAEHAAVAQCAVVGETDGDGLGRAAAYVVPSRCPPDGPAARALAEELRAHLAGRLAGHKVPGRIEIREGLPLTPTGKVRRTALSA